MVALPIWPEFIGPRDIDLKLNRVNSLLNLLGNPEKDLNNIIHVAGTNGKGSTIAYLRAFLESSGYSVNCYTSPHLVEFNERIRLSGKLISDEELNRLGLLCKELSKDLNEELTFFEATTVMAIKAFADNKADFNIFEVGLGGRLDATNIFKGDKSVAITPISYDHQEFLGDKLSEIAFEKAAIITDNSKLFIGKQQKEALDVIKNRALEKNAQIIEHHIEIPDNIGLKGEHQKDNFSLAAQIFFELSGKRQISQNFLEKLSWPGRLQKLPSYNGCEIYLDGGHNIAAAEILYDWIIAENIDHVVISMVKRKDIEQFVKIMEQTSAKLYFCEMESCDESLKISDLSKDLQKKFEKRTFNNYRNMLELLDSQAQKGKTLFCGSLFFIGEILENGI